MIFNERPPFTTTYENKENELDKIIDDIINENKFVVNINSSKKKEENFMLGNEKDAQLNFLKGLKCEQDEKIAQINNEDFNVIVETRIADYRGRVIAELQEEKEAKLLKLNNLVEAINDKIAELEAVEVEDDTTEEVAEVVDENNEINYAAEN